MELSIVWAPPVVLGVLIFKFYWQEVLFQCGLKCPQAPETKEGLDKMYGEWKEYYFIPLCAFALMEEFMFRYFPILCSLILMKLYGPWSGIATVMVAQIVFGISHGNIRNIPFQGVAGIMYTFLFVLFGGLHNFALGICVATTAHLVWNMNCRYRFLEKYIPSLS
ncbi:MAG: CPBP family glutamic-type intramembrane protease [Candidatus Paceibacterota bacterium]|jgi:membrane protease YdiL (CAAX protease family)